FQCYAAENYESVHELYEKQRDKITKDIGKLSYQNKIIEIKNLLGENTLIKQWILVVPQHRSRHLISHANKKAEELKKDQNRPSYISEDFVAHIWTEEDLIANCGRLENSIEEITQIFSIRGPWAQLVYKSELWPLETDPILKISSAKIADLCWEYIDESNNPWSDNDYPSRIIKNILLIIKQLDNLKLTTEEVIFLLTIPFLKHVLIYLTENIQFDCAQINDLKPNSDLSVSNVYREQYEMFIAKCPQLERKAIRLQSQGKNEFSWITWWIFSKSIRNIPSTFSFDYKNTNDEFFNQYSEITKNISKLKKIENYRSLLISDGIDIDEIINRPDVFESQSILENKSKTIRLSIISIIFSLAGKMSFDPLMLSGAIVDHINVSYPTSPEMVLSNLRSTNWILESNSFQLDLTCNHPAIDLAISEVVDKLSFFHKYILQYIKEKKSNFQELTNLPQFKKDRLHSKKINGLDIYLKPHVSFKLSQDEIKELLMGEKLYSNQTFAIRELYQNALDACRYQETRYKYLLKKSGLSEDEIPWKGKIKIEQGIDPDRGVYIECIDNGIGMRQSDIINFFAKAGKRFVEGDDYLQEKIDWQKFGLEHYPNSQFGIGVFSYFMLAEEIEITTRYVNKDQSLENTLLVNISGSGSLLHIRNTKNEMISHGTKIRLYLHKTSYKDINENEIKISALSTLKEHLWIAYFKTSVIEGEQNQIWEPFELNSKNKSLSMHKKASELDLIKIDNDLWWLGEDDIGFIDNKDVKGRILADGLITETKVPSLLVNLHGKNRSRLSLDRRKILDWPKNKIESKLNEFGWKALIDKPFMKALSFYVVAKYYPIVIQQFLAHWNNQLKLPLKTLYVDTQYDLKELGISIDDLELMSFVQGGRVVADDELDGWIRFLMHKNKDDIVQRFLSLRSQIALKPYVIEWLERQSDFSNDTNYIHNKKNTISDINSIEFKIKNYYSKFSINNPILFMDKINNINQIDDIDIEIFSDEIGFPTNKVSKWKLFLLIFTNKISKDVLLEKLRKWSVISNIEDIDGKYNNDNLGLSFINDKFTIPISDSFFLFKIISNEIARNIEINK
ncbi:MAG: ATP-binding protein, partial [Nanoarchaeota archaeon]|nr:ATP-binding protein [Nanoarchaeota archaeon]